ncbi:hypothetical protein [Paenibacillus sp. RUD330]|uniref:hypothetical protein n=1 Tax=Paenibacillus sp. RUD330 TaxID=2023772 RepID=UPI000B927D03|nr:hypothetical protein [Paenibacillus sp. RUD330]ASS66226.1 hypothetical protein CIC07_08740 [Paenibacillus sp. RUD330]
MEELQAKLDRLKWELSTENQRGSLKEAGKVAELEAQIAETQARIDAENNKQVEVAVATAQESIYNLFDRLDFDGNVVRLRDIMVNEQAYQMLSVTLQQAFGDLAERGEKNALALKESYANEIADKDRRIQSLLEEISVIGTENGKLDLELQDMTSKRDAAVRALEDKDAQIDQLQDQLSEAKADVERLEKDVQALRDAATAKAPVIKTTEDIKQETLDSLIPVTNIRWKENSKNTTYQAEDAKTGDTIEFSWLAKGKYREVTAEEAAQFRSEAEHAPESNGAGQEAPVPASPPLDLNPPELQFPPAVPDEDTTGGLAEGDAGGTVAEKTLEERVAALEKAVWGKVESAA